MSRLLFTSGDTWTKSQLEATLDVLTEMAHRELQFTLLPNKVLMVNVDEMCDAYACHGLPHMYAHWSMGKEVQDLRNSVRNGEQGLAYELVVPTDPCISWNMTSNSAATMALVLAHAAIGHNFVFKNNVEHKKHTYYGMLSHYGFEAKQLVARCEALYGQQRVEALLDAAHALAIPGSVFRYGEPEPFSIEKEKARVAELMRSLEQGLDSSTLVTIPGVEERLTKRHEIRESEIRLPEENILYFIEKYSPKLQRWEREILRMVRRGVQQMQYPFMLLKLVHEGFATFTHNYLTRRLREEGYIDDGTFQEILILDQGVVGQRMYADTKRFNAINPYFFGTEMFKEIVRISAPQGADAQLFRHWIDMSGPTPEDRKWFKYWAGKGDWREMIREAGSNYNNETFVSQFLSPALMRKLKMFALKDEGKHFLVTDIHDEQGYGDLRHALAESYSYDALVPRVEVESVDLAGDRKLTLRHKMYQGMDLVEEDRDNLLLHIEELWGFPVEIKTSG